MQISLSQCGDVLSDNVCGVVGIKPMTTVGMGVHALPASAQM